jgi:hypothetical protein
MRLRSSCGYDPNDVIPHRIGDKKHSAFDKANYVEAHLAGGAEFVELDYIRVQEHLRGRSEVDAVLLPVGLLLGGVLSKSIGEPRLPIYWYSVQLSRPGVL